MPQLFEPLVLRSIVLRNRIGMAPMCTYSAKEGAPTSWHLVHYGARAIGGSALIIVEATAIEPPGRISPADLGLWDDAQAQAWQPITQFIKEHGAVPCIQLGHSGRKGATGAPAQKHKPLSNEEGGWETIAPSPLAYADGYSVPRELAADELEQLVGTWTKATRRALIAGFSAVELHIAHGFLLHEFLSPLSNKRADEYGGDLENRMRFPLMVAESVRTAWPDELPVLARISATDWVPGGFDVPEAVEFAKRLKALGIDLIDCSSGGLLPEAQISPVELDQDPGYQVPLAEAVKREAGVATAAVGLLNAYGLADFTIRSEQADMVLLGRELLRSPNWPLKDAVILDADWEWPWQYERAKP